MISLHHRRRLRKSLRLLLCAASIDLLFFVAAMLLRYTIGLGIIDIVRAATGMPGTESLYVGIIVSLTL